MIVVLAGLISGSALSDQENPDVAVVPSHSWSELVSNKLDPVLLELAIGLEGKTDSDGNPIRVMVALKAPLSEADAARLEAAGLAVGGIAGDIVTGSVKPGDLMAVAADPAVIKLESSQPLEPEAPDQMPEGG